MSADRAASVPALGLGFALLVACGKTHASLPAERAAPAPSASTSVPSYRGDACGPYLTATGPRQLGYSLPGDPAAHPSCALSEAGDLQCPQDFVGFTPTSKVTVPLDETRALLAEAEATALAAGCVTCQRDEPARLCKSEACIEVCSPLKYELPVLRAEYAKTETRLDGAGGRAGRPSRMRPRSSPAR